MTPTQYNNNVKLIRKKCDEVMTSKGKSYAENDDVLASFKRSSERTGLSVFQIWQVYFNKHVDSINNAIKHSPKYPQDNSEGIESRIIDLINYSQFLHMLLTEFGEDQCSRAAIRAAHQAAEFQQKAQQDLFNQQQEYSKQKNTQKHKR